MSSPSQDQLIAWRTFLETSLAVIDLIDHDLQVDSGLSVRWYDVLIALESALDGIRMNELADRILSSKSGLTRVVDRMAGVDLVRRERPAHDRRVVTVFLTENGAETLRRARARHHESLQRHVFDHIAESDLVAVAIALDGVRGHARNLRPGRISG